MKGLPVWPRSTTSPISLNRLLSVVVLLCAFIAAPHTARAKTWGKKGFVAGLGVGYGGVLEREQHRWVYHATLRLGWTLIPELTLLLENQVFFNLPKTGKNGARFYQVLHAPMVLAQIVRGLFFRGGVGFVYQFERGIKNKTRYGIAGIVGLGYFVVTRAHFALTTELQVVPILLGSSGQYLLQAGLGFHFQ